MYLGLDLGTSGLKGVLTDRAGAVIGTAASPLTVSRPKDGWSEQNPNDWIRAAELVLDQLATQFHKQLQALAGIGLSGQMHGATAIDKAGQVIRPAILWNDTRSHAEAAELDALPDFRAKTGNIVFPGFTAPKILWMQRHEAELYGKIDKVVLPKDYLRLWLTGDAVSEMSDASGTSWLDVGRRDWKDSLLAATGLSRDNMPELVEGNAPGGCLRNSLAARWNLPKSIPVAGGAGDNAAAAIGVGVVQAGQAFASLGTSGVLFAASDTYAPNPGSAVHTFCHALPDTWHQMGVILAATDALEWYSRISGKTAAELAGELGDELRRPGAVQFLPYLGGERTPHNNAEIRGAFSGLSHGDDRAALSHAVMQGVAFAFRDNLAALQSTGTRIDELTAVGGGSNSLYWLELLATVLNLPINVPIAGDFGAAFGAARLGMMASTGALATEVCTPPVIASVIQPRADLTSEYVAAYTKFSGLYPALKGS